MTNRSALLSLAAAALAATCLPALAQSGLTNLGALNAGAASYAYGVSADGAVVADMLADKRAFIARVSAAGSGLVTLDDVQHSLGTAARGRAMTLGQTWARQDLELNGRAKTEGTYLLAEALVPLAGSLWATFGAHFERGQADLRRGYLNAGRQDFSIASPRVNARGARARLDWENARRLAGTDFSPFLDLSYRETKLAAYTETGGGFPARFEARTEKALPPSPSTPPPRAP